MPQNVHCHTTKLLKRFNVGRNTGTLAVSYEEAGAPASYCNISEIKRQATITFVIYRLV